MQTEKLFGHESHGSWDGEEMPSPLFVHPPLQPDQFISIAADEKLSKDVTIFHSRSVDNGGFENATPHARAGVKRNRRQ